METIKINGTTFNVEAVKKMGSQNFCEVYENILKNPKKVYSEITKDGEDFRISKKIKKSSKKFEGKTEDFEHGNGRKEVGEDISG